MPKSPNVDLGATLGGTGATRVVLLAVLDPAWDQHGQPSVPVRRRRVLRSAQPGRWSSAGVRRSVADGASPAPAPASGVVAPRRGRPGAAARTGPLAAAASRAAACAALPLARWCRRRHPCRSRPSRRSGRTSCGPRRSRSRCSRAACAAAPDPRGRTPSGDISAPPRRPEHCTRMPLAPAFIADCIDLRIARRKRDAAGQLLGDTLRDELRVDLGVLHLEDVELHLLAGELLEVAADAVGLGAAATDDDARTGGVDVDADPVTGALDLDPADAGALHALGHEAADRDVFLDVVAVGCALLSANQRLLWSVVMPRRNPCGLTF